MDGKVNKGNAEESSEPPKETHVKPHNDVLPTKKSSKELRKVDDKSVEYVMKALNSLHSPEEKLAAMCKKYTEIVDENRKLQVNGKQWEKKYVMNQREKEQLQLEYNKTVLLKAKLENLCRELQKQNKAVKDESLLKIREEEERRNKTQAKFQTTLTEITALMQQNNDKSTKLRDDNLDITKKFKSVMEQYELQEQQVDKMSQQMELESQLHEAKLNKANLEAQAERERHIAEKSQLLENVTRMQALITEMRATEVVLKCQVSAYSNKYDEFQNALTKSNEVFGGFRGKMEKMQKKILKLEKETTVWKQRWEKSHAALLDMAAEKQQRDARTAVQGRQLRQLQKLCRTMQADRTTLLKTLQDNNIERPPLPQLPEEPEIPVPTDTVDRVDAMAANCAQLKLSLAQLQGQLNVITANSAAKSEESAKLAIESAAAENAAPAHPKNKSKKGKGKKNKQNESKDSVKESQEENLPVSDITTPEIAADVMNEVPNFMPPEISNDLPRVPDDISELGTDDMSSDIISAKLLESISSPALVEVLKNISSPAITEDLENISCPIIPSLEEIDVSSARIPVGSLSTPEDIGTVSLPEVNAALAELLATVVPSASSVISDKQTMPTFSQMLGKSSPNVLKELETSLPPVVSNVVEKLPSSASVELSGKALSNAVPEMLANIASAVSEKLDKNLTASEDDMKKLSAGAEELLKSPVVSEKLQKPPVIKKKGKKETDKEVSAPELLEKASPVSVEIAQSIPASTVEVVNSIPTIAEVANSAPTVVAEELKTDDPIETPMSSSPKSAKNPVANASPKKNKGKGSPKNCPVSPVSNGDTSPDSTACTAPVVTEVPKVATPSVNSKNNALPAL